MSKLFYGQYTRRALVTINFKITTLYNNNTLIDYIYQKPKINSTISKLHRQNFNPTLINYQIKTIRTPVLVKNAVIIGVKNPVVLPIQLAIPYNVPA